MDGGGKGGQGIHLYPEEQRKASDVACLNCVAKMHQAMCVSGALCIASCVLDCKPIAHGRNLNVYSNSSSYASFRNVARNYGHVQ